MSREEMVEAGAQALLASPWVVWAYREVGADPVGRVHHSAAAHDARTVLDAIEPLIRAEERDAWTKEIERVHREWQAELARIEPLLRERILRVVEYLGQEPQGLPWYVTQGILGTNAHAEAWVDGMEGGSR